jgi:hypothetical protein
MYLEDIKNHIIKDKEGTLTGFSVAKTQQNLCKI